MHTRDDKEKKTKAHKDNQTCHHRTCRHDQTAVSNLVTMDTQGAAGREGMNGVLQILAKTSDSDF